MAIPLLNYAPVVQNARVNGYEVSGDDQPVIFSTENILGTLDLNNLIEAAYRQIFFHAFKSDREPFLESQLRNNQITVREFIRGLLLSDTYKRNFYNLNSNYRFVEQTVQRVLGRDIYGEAEKLSWAVVVGNKGYTAFVDQLLNSDEYLDNFGYETVPYQRRRSLPGRGLGETPFNIKSPRYDEYYRNVLGFPKPVVQAVIRSYKSTDRQPKTGDPALYMNWLSAINIPLPTGGIPSTGNISMSKVPYRK